jgi:biopolymer transport protein ExbD
MKSRIKEASEIDITPMIDMVFQLIIFFMVVMAIAVVYGVAIKFPPPGGNDRQENKKKKEKTISVMVSQDEIRPGPGGGHVIVRDGIVKINGEEIALTHSPISDYDKWEKEREQAFDELQERMQRLVEKGYKSDILFIQGDMKAYHSKIMRVIDRGKRVRIPGKTETDPKTGEVRPKVGIDGFSLVPPQ